MSKITKKDIKEIRGRLEGRIASLGEQIVIAKGKIEILVWALEEIELLETK